MTKEYDLEENAGSKNRSWFQVRYLMIFLLFLAMASNYCMRINLSIAIVAMTDNSSNTDFEHFDWDSTTRNTILSSFFWGYIVLQVPSGLIAQALGAKWLLLAGTLLCSVMTLITPVVSHVGGWGGLCAVRIVQGLSQGALFPSSHALLANWSPPAERGRLAGIVFSGMQLGAVLTFPLSGVLAESAAGWPSIFYLFGGMGLAWCVIWFFLGASKPEQSFLISNEEKEYILLCQGSKPPVQSVKVPWLRLLFSGPMWAVLLAHCAQNWGFWTLMTEMPTYMGKVLDFDIKANGLLSALPYLAQGLFSYACGFLADFLYHRKILTPTWSRKIFNSIGMVIPCIALACLGYVPKEQVDVAVALLVVCVGVNAGVYVGFQINHIDLSPNFASTMMGITNGISNIFSIIGPLLVGIVVTDEHNTEQWRIIFWVAAVIYLIGDAAFVLFGSAEIQPFDSYGTSENSVTSEPAAANNNEKSEVTIKQDS